MKNFYFFASLLMLLSFLLSACSTGSTASVQNVSVPPNSYIIANINVPQMLEKSGGYKDSIFSIINNEGLSNIVTSLNEQALLFVTQNNVVGISLSSNEMIDKTILMEDYTWIPLQLENPVDGFELSYVQTGTENMLMAVHPERLIYLYADEVEEAINVMTPQLRWETLIEASLLDLLNGKTRAEVFTPDEIKELSAEHDFSFIINSTDSALYSFVESEFENYDVPMTYTAMDEPTITFTALNFENGEIKMVGKALRTPKEQQELMNSSADLSGNINGYVQENAQLYTAIATQLLVPVFDRYLIEDVLPADQIEIAKKVSHSLEGDLVIAGDFNMLIPNLIFAVEVKDDTIIELINQHFPLGEPIDGYENVYKFQQAGVDFYIGVANNIFFATNIEASYQALMAGEPLEKNVNTLPYMKKCKGDAAAIFIALEEIVKNNPYSKQFNAVQYPMVSKLKSIEYDMISKEEGEFSILLTEDDMNALELILQEVTTKQ